MREVAAAEANVVQALAAYDAYTASVAACAEKCALAFASARLSAARAAAFDELTGKMAGPLLCAYFA